MAAASGEDAFWELVEAAGESFASRPEKDRYDTIQTQVDAALGTAGGAPDVSLSTREYSPTVQMYRPPARGATRAVARCHARSPS